MAGKQVKAWAVRLTPGRVVGNPCRICGGKIRYLRRGKWAGRCVACALKKEQRVQLERKRVWRQKLYDEVIKAYGAKCKCCGETIRLFLTLDHVEAIGGQKTRPGIVATYIDARRRGFPDDYQVLCFNCNCGRARNGGICPHTLR